VVESELDRPIERAFAEFDEAPLGAASIAQAHRARLPGGDPVVVKVQYPWLAASLAADLRIARWVLVWGSARRGSGGADVLFREFGDGLREELDFEHEARVAAEIATNLAGDASVLVPEVIATHSARRVLTVRHHPAVAIDDKLGLARLGVPPRAVLEILARAYCTQVFTDGLFHADPHPGNLFVVDEPGAATRPRLLFVDFGLSRRLDPALRHELRLGIHALLRRDVPAFLDGMERLGAIAPGHRGDAERAVALMFARVAASGGLAAGGAQVLSLKDEAVALLRETPGLRLPADLLLYAKTLSYVFSLGSELDADVDMMKLCLPSLLRFLAAKE
jgi:predicted unusual protein kinase regulating ubiquinone biosynthesis (AarF/ABC1/UbiB family)